MGLQIFIQCQSQNHFTITVVLLLSVFLRLVIQYVLENSLTKVHVSVCVYQKSQRETEKTRCEQSKHELNLQP